MAVLEVCVDSVGSAIAAQQGGANRIELCADLLEGGITPGPGLISVVRSRLKIDVFVMIRPRAGDFLYSEDEIEVMERDMDETRRLGADGFVLGILTEHATVDVERTRELVKRAHPLPVTFHRAIDMTPDPLCALEDVIASGAHRVLTSGGASNVTKGAEMLAQMKKVAGNRIALMAGGGLTLKTVQHIVESTGVTEYHASLRKAMQSPTDFHKPGVVMGEVRDREYLRYATHSEDVQAMVNRLEALSHAHLVKSGNER
jgi:copper homeostasis protein